MARRSGKQKAVGSRAEVWHGTAHHTSGGLQKKDLFKKNDRIKSKRASQAAKRSNNLGSHKQPRNSGVFGPKNR